MVYAKLQAPSEGDFWQSEAEGCATEKPLSAWSLRKYYEKYS